MKALFRHTLRSAADSKAQVFIIILTVAVVTAMIFASFSISDVFYNLNMIENDRVAQGADMLLGSNGSASEFFSRARVDSVLNKTPQDIARTEYFLKFTTVIKYENATKTVLLEATDLNEYVEKHDLHYVEYSENKTGIMPAIIGKTFSDTTGLHAGDTIEVYIASYDKYIDMVITYVASDEGIFKSAVNNNILVDFSAVGNYGMVSAVYLTFTDAAYFTQYQTEFQAILPAVSCREGNNYSAVKDIVFNNTLLFGIGLLFIVATMGLILLTSYMIVARKRTREMIVFKAAGASPAITALIMLLEVAVYASAGAIIGTALGRFAMQLIVNNMLPYGKDLISYEIWKYAVSLIIAFSVTIAASLAPIIAVSRKTIRELNADSPRLAKPPKPLVCGILTLVAAGALAATIFLKGIWVAVLSIADIVLIVVWVSYAAPFALKAVAAVLRKIHPVGGFGLGTMTLNRSKAMRTITALVAVIIAFSFMVVQIVGLVKYAVTPFSDRYSADAVVLVSSPLTEEQRFELVESLHVEGVEEVGLMNGASFELPRSRMDLTASEKAFSLYGVDNLWMLEHCSSRLSEGTAERWRETQNPIVLSEDMMIRLGYALGDTVSYKTVSEDYDDKEFIFTIVGVDHTITRYDRIGYTKFDIIKDISTGCTCFVDYLQGADQDAALLGLIRTVDAQNIERSFVLTFDEWTEAESTGIEGIIGILSIVQYAIIAVSLIGIVNISVVTVYDRKSELELYRLSGLSHRGYVAFSVSEGLSVSLAGGLAGFAVCTSLNALLPVFVGIVDKYLHFGIVSALSAYITVAGAFAFAACWMMIAAVGRTHGLKTLNERFLT
ncbi:MAG: hypothetical protein PHI19_03020 [Clostridia bacterium]|nr:hypothetical protein [Clostridia bacterium]